MKPKFKAGDSLIYVDPFVFFLERVQISFPDIDENGKKVWIGYEGEYFFEENLFTNLDEAKQHAQTLLEKFYNKQLNIIKNYRIL